MPKITYTNTKGLIQETGTEDVNLSGHAIMKGHKRDVKTITEATTILTKADSGKLILIAVGSNAATTITLPELSSSLIGVTYEFVPIITNSGGILIKSGDVTDTTGDVFIGGLVGAANAVSNGGANANGRFISASAVGNCSQIKLDSNLANNTMAKGTHFSCTAVSATQWYVEGIFSVSTATANLSAIFSNI